MSEKIKGSCYACTRCVFEPARPWDRGSRHSIPSTCPELRRAPVCQTHTWARSCPCSLRSFLAMSMSWCPAAWVSGGPCDGSTQVFPQIFPLLLLLKFH